MRIENIGETIGENEYFEYRGDVTVAGNIGNNATVIVVHGSLSVGGHIGEGAHITLQSVGAIRVQGNVGNNARIKSQSASIIVGGDIGSNVNIDTQSGDIRAANVGVNSTLKTMSGNIVVANVGASCSLETTSGYVNASDVAERSTLKTMGGNVKIRSAHATATLETMSGKIYENGVQRERDRRSAGSVLMSITPPRNGVRFGSVSVISSGNVTFFQGSNERRVIVNGRDVTDLVNAASSAQQPFITEGKQSIMFNSECESGRKI